MFYVDIVKYNETTDHLTWIGFNKVISNGQIGWQTFEVPVEEQIIVEPNWSIAIHYDENDDDYAVIPTTSDTGDGIDKIPLGFEIMLNHEEISSLTPVGVENKAKISEALDELDLRLGNVFRTPALAVVIEPL